MLGSLLLRHMVQLVTNAHAVTELLEDEEAGSVEQVRLSLVNIGHVTSILASNWSM